MFTLSSTNAEIKDDGKSEKNIKIITTMGEFEVELYWEHAPKTCRNFQELCSKGYYDNTVFHRIVKNFIIQGGDPTGTGRGGESIYEGYLEDEIHVGLKHTGAGIICMANEGTPNTNGSQFFITLAPCPFLDGKNTIFGRIKVGLDVIKRISNTQTTAANRPVLDVKIIRTC